MPDWVEIHQDPYTKRIRWPEQFLMFAEPRERPVQLTTVGVGALLAAQLAADESFLYRLSPGEFEEFICDRLAAMGLDVRQVGKVNRKDGGIDIVFWPKVTAFPFFGAAQVKHHRDPKRKEGHPTVRDFAGAISGRPFGAGVIVTNTGFTPDAEWFARERSNIIRLRDLRDVRRWIGGNFAQEHEWREVPETLELCPGVTVKLR